MIGALILLTRHWRLTERYSGMARRVRV